jgi:hypothetical protein
MTSTTRRASRTLLGECQRRRARGQDVAVNAAPRGPERRAWRRQGRCFIHRDGREGERTVRLSHGGVASGDERESAAASGDAVGRPTARTGWSVLHLPSTPDVISFTVRARVLAGRWMRIVRPRFVLTTSPSNFQERSLGHGPISRAHRSLEPVGCWFFFFFFFFFLIIGC